MEIQAGRQAGGRAAGGRAGRQAGRQAGRRAGRFTPSCPVAYLACIHAHHRAELELCLRHLEPLRLACGMPLAQLPALLVLVHAEHAEGTVTAR